MQVEVSEIELYSTISSSSFQRLDTSKFNSLQQRKYDSRQSLQKSRQTFFISKDGAVGAAELLRKKWVSYLFLSFLRLMQSQSTSIHGGRPRESRRSTLDLFSGDTNPVFNLPLLLLMLRLIWYLIEKQTAGVHGITPPAFYTCTHNRQVYFK